MMKEKKTGMLKKGMAIAVTAVAVFASASTILAYEPLRSTNEDAVAITYEGDFSAFQNESNPQICDYSISDRIFTYEDGTQIPVTGEASTYALCNHTLVKGYYSVHISNNTGGCTVKEYNAKRCTKCGYIEVGSLYATHTYTVCTHK